MSENESAAGRQDVWIEKYRPASLEGVVGHDEITDRLGSFVERNDLPNLLFSGPAGVGKCVTGDTPLVTNRGVERIGQVVGDEDGFSTPNPDLRVATFTNDGSIEFVEPSQTFSRQVDGLVSVSTRDGGEITATPEHPLLVINGNGFDWKPAKELSPGDQVARPAQLPTPNSDGSIDWIDSMDASETFVHVTESFARKYDIPIEENHVGFKKEVLKRLRNDEDVEKIAETIGIPKKTVQTYQREFTDVSFDTFGTTCSLAFLNALDADRDELQEHVQAIQFVSQSNNIRSRRISPPWQVTPELAEFIGLAVSEARIDGGRIQFYNSDEALLSQFEHAAESEFDVDTTRGENKGVPFVEIGSKTLTHYLESCFDVFAGATGGNGIGSSLLRASEECRASFLRAVFDAEAHVTRGGIIELTQKNERLITLLSYLLSTFGVISRRNIVEKQATNSSGPSREYHQLRLSESKNLARFEEAIGFTLESKRTRLAEATARTSNPNRDTMPTQNVVDDICDSLYLPKSELLTRSLDPENPGRERYLSDLATVRDAALERVEIAQEVHTGVERLQREIEQVTGLPTTWLAERDKLGPIETRRSISESTGIRSDSLLTYADGRHTPTSSRTQLLLDEVGVTLALPDVSGLQSELRDLISQLGVPYAHLAEDTPYLGTDFINLVENEDHDLGSLPRFETLATRLRSEASNMLTDEVLTSLQSIERLAGADLHFDEIEQVERIDEEARVYDLTVPDTHNYVAGNIPVVNHNTASAVAIARELYGDDWADNFMELNASDERGIDVVRDRIKNFARSSFGGAEYRIIFLDEADSLTSEAQAALRRTMEQFSHNTRFILSCNYSSQIIDPIQSRCTVFRFGPIPDDAVAERIREIADAEGIEVTDDGVDALVYAADGDMRRAINGLQAAAVMGDVVDEEIVFTTTSTARPEDIEAMVRSALDGEFTAARNSLDELVTEQGLAGGDIIDQLHRSVWDFDLEDEAAVRLLERIGETDYRIAEGANERLQLEALLASIAKGN